MLAKYRSRSANKSIRQDDGRGGATGIVDKDVMRARRPDLAVLKFPTAIVAEADHRKTAFWSSVLNYLVESFALCGASLHPTALFVAGPDPEEETIPKTRDVSPGEPPGWISSTASQDAASLELERKTAHGMVAGHVVALSDHRSRERERKIQNAVAALAALDDRTLLDMGIPHRSRIEQAVRYCHDC
jgi:hypothetical protein